MTPNTADNRAYFFKIDTTIKKIRQGLQKKLDDNNVELTVDQWVLLDHIYRFEAKGLSQNELAEMTVKDAPTVTRIIDLLVKKGLTERTMAENDRRKFNITLTNAGRDKFNEAYPIVAEVRRKGWGDLNDEDYQTFVRILDSIYSNVTSHQ
jgi:DNA-binding MarR family transcriptional regulator